METMNSTKTRTMTTIYNTQLFNELLSAPEWETLWTTDASGKYPETKIEIPTLLGGLDHITKTKKYVTFHDVGMNGKTHSFRIGRES